MIAGASTDSLPIMTAPLDPDPSQLINKRLRLMVLPPTPRKKRKSTRIISKSAILTRGRGALKGFVDLPLDLIFETAKYLHPKDLLAFSRLSQRFRAIFMTRSASFVWREAISNIATLAKCPRDLTEPQYASFVFDEFCMACGNLGPECKSFPTLRLRLCARCRPLNLANGHTLSQQVENMGREAELNTLLSIIPSSDSSYKHSCSTISLFQTRGRYHY
ncbi:hypothetical protein BDZ97DRAFT_207623 [Flammula alnicola]|nr:hypothetical protein BDZ97DRAFT_207623 [Flammula alnicola]